MYVFPHNIQPPTEILHMGRRAKRGELDFEMSLVMNNSRAVEEGPKRKHWSIHDLKSIKALTPAQEDMFYAWNQGHNICAHGSAGTGKTFLACCLALGEVVTRRMSRIILVRSAVPTRDIGFLPGTLEEKIANYERPYHDIFWELIGRESTYNDMKEEGIVEFMTTSFLRGLTWDNAIVVVDEAENMTFHEIDSIITRLGNNTRIIINGDARQTDLDGSKRLGSEGLSQTVKVLENMEQFSIVKFTYHDIVRSNLVKSWIMASERVVGF